MNNGCGVIMIWKFLYKLASPQHFYRISEVLLPWFGILAIGLFIVGLVTGLFLAPPDYQQGDAFRIIYVHVPSAFTSLFIYTMMTFCAILSLVWKIKMADHVIKASITIGAWLTFLALLTGSVWGKPMWGSWWIWDPRLTSELILLFIYLGIYALQQAIPNRMHAAKAVAILLIVGFVDIPIIHYSVSWWNSLHQGATIAQFARPTIAASMLYPLLFMIFAFLFYYLSVLLISVRAELLEQDKKARWVRQVLFG